nr:sugar-transfer associated ATP-grasp domain-containing protein [uncultured Roseateles sp.]
MHHKQGLRQLYRWARQAHEESGLPVWRQFLEALLLRLPPARLGLTEYFDYRLFSPHLRFRDKQRFVGWRGEPALDRANASNWRAYADDKILLDQLLADAGLPRPRLHAVFRAGSPSEATVARLDTDQALVDWLRRCTAYPLFAKPAHAGFGRGAYLLEQYRPNDDSLLLGQGQVMPVQGFVAGLKNPGQRGYLFQECLRPHPKLADLQCQRLSGLRVMTLKPRGAAAVIFRAVWKLPRRHNIIDNFESGSTGNLLAGVDLQTGQVLRVIQGYGLDLKQLSAHPDSGLGFDGLRLPDWAALRATTLAAAELMPEFRFQHWDVALTERGPVLLEVNLFTAGGTELSQLVEQRGLLEPRLLAQCRPG